MNFVYDILIPFFVGLLGIYFAYSIFDVFLKFSFEIVSSIKEGIKKKKTKHGKWLIIVLYALIVSVGTIVVSGNIIGDDAFTTKAMVRILFGLVGFSLFIAFTDSPLHKKYKNTNEDK